MYELINSGNINRLDTPYFTTLAKQNEYFDNRVVVSIDAYFPPYYTNEIKFSLSQNNILKLSVVFDYLRIKFKDKYYYYFIDNKVYLNEDIISLTLTMDVIQTYYFDYAINGGNINRLCIDRWKTYDRHTGINRDYIRENLSNDTFIYKDYTEYDKPNTNLIMNNDSLYFVLVTAKPIATTLSTNMFIDNLSSNLYYYLIPSSKYSLEIKSNTLGNVKLLSTYDILNTDILKNNSVYKMFAITNTSVSQLFNLVYSGNLITSYDTDLLSLNNMPPIDNTVYYLLRIIEFNNLNNIEGVEISYMTSYDLLTGIINFEQNTSINKKFNVKYVPQIIDTNYIHIEFGENMQSTTYPLEKAMYIRPTGYFTYDLFTNTRSYYITDGYEKKDVFSTLINNSSIEEYEIVNDNWLTYQAQHKGDLTTGIALSKMNNGYNALRNTITSASQVIGGVATGRITPQITGTTNAILSMSDFLIGSYNIDQQLKITKENLESAPNQVKQGNVLNADKLTNSFVTMKRVTMCSDITTVAKRYELFGYKVSIQITNSNAINFNNIMSNYFLRYYWNILQIDTPTIKSLNGTLVSEIEKDNIRSRYTNGIRFINVDEIPVDEDLHYNFDYDNVEKRYLQ